VCLDSTVGAAIWAQTNSKAVSVAAVAPTAPATGEAWWDTVNKELKVYDGTTWVSQERTNNYSATVAPASSNDTTQGYDIGSVWIDTVSDSSYVCVDNTTGAAIWHQIDLAGEQSNLSAIVPPAVTDDSSLGYSVGSHWIDVANDNSYICVDASVGTAVWVQTNNQGAATASAVAPVGPVAGDLWWDTVNKELKVYDGVAWVSQERTNNYAATAAPVVTNDSSQGYDIGSIWIDVTNDKAYTCVDNTAGAAVWSAGGGGATVSTIAPTVTAADAGLFWYDPTDSNTYVWNGTAWVDVTAAGGSVVKNNYTAGIAPTVADDTTAGYSVGSRWVDTAAGNSYACVDATAGAAVWKQTSNLQDNLAAVVAPTVTDDSAAGYAVGSTWIDTVLGIPYICTDSTAGAAVWKATLSVGDGQTWQDMTLSRAVGVTYTNTTGRPIMVGLKVKSSANNRSLDVTIGGVIAMSIFERTTPSGGTFIVPTGATYSIAHVGGGTSTITLWNELR